jgi:hypothetical protein
MTGGTGKKALLFVELTFRTHGVCAVCREVCVPKNRTALLENNKCYLGGNFYCNCGSQYLGTPCYALEAISAEESDTGGNLTIHIG